MWYMYAKTNGKISDDELTRRLKDIIRSNKFILRMFKEFGVPIDAIEGDNLSFHVSSLDGRYAQSKGTDIFLSDKLFEDNFFKDGIHFAVHELTHWLTRQREALCYLADPEEIDAFSFSMAYELLRGTGEEELKELFFPILESHFEEEIDAGKVFVALMTKAKAKISDIS